MGGGAIHTDIMGEVRMVNCLFVANTTRYLGGAIHCLNHNDGTGRSLFKLLNCTFYGNTSPTFAYPPTPNPQFLDPHGADGISGTEDDDFRLAPDSPAIDSGTNETEPPLPPSELDGNPRILNDVVDLGAYEFAGSLYPDFDSPFSDQITYGGGTGEPNDPYLIYTAEQTDQSVDSSGAVPDLS